MDQAWSPLTNRLLHLTLEVISLLTGEDYVLVRKSGEGGASGGLRRSQKHLMLPQTSCLRSKEQKILEVVNKMMELLTGGVTSEDSGNTFCAGGKLPNTQDNAKSQGAGGKSHCPALSPAHFKKEREELSSEGKATMTVKVVMKEEDFLEDEELTSSNSNDRNEEPPPCMEAKEESPGHLMKRSSLIGAEDDDTDVYSAAELGSISVKEEPDFCEIRHLIDFVEQGQNPTTSPTGQQRTNQTFSCSRCAKSFDNHMDLLNHHHLTCSECGKCFAYKSQLIFHMRSHTGERPFTCPICGKSFASTGVLVRHQITHTGEKLFSCANCEKCFGSKSDLIIHQRIHTGQKPYTCVYCGNCFNTASSLARHRRIHTGEKPFPCSQCKKSFVNSSDLINHQRVHTGERPFSCLQCGKCFTCKSGLAKHQRTHCKQRRYSCSDCQVTFYAASKLKEHQKTHQAKNQDIFFNHLDSRPALVTTREPLN